jgi:hypothetical protein
VHAIQSAAALGEILYEVSDGSSKRGSLSFGWVIGTETGQKLAWGKGPGYGTDTSHRAESWGKLSAAKFLYHLSRFTRIPLPTTTRLISFADNKGLITTLQKRLQYQTAYPNSCLKTVWDLTEEVVRTYHSTSIPNFAFVWVKGRQDATKPARQLPIEAQYNVLADQLAN